MDRVEIRLSSEDRSRLGSLAFLRKTSISEVVRILLDEHESVVMGQLASRRSS